MIHTSVDELHISNPTGEITQLHHTKVVRFLRIPIYKYTFYKEIDDSKIEFISQSPPYEGKVIGFGAPMVNTREEVFDDLPDQDKI